MSMDTISVARNHVTVTCNVELPRGLRTGNPVSSMQVELNLWAYREDAHGSLLVERLRDSIARGEVLSPSTMELVTSARDWQQFSQTILARQVGLFAFLFADHDYDGDAL